MFTGIVEDMGTVESVRDGGGGIKRYRFVPRSLPCGELSMGESIAIDGCCLTVVGWDERSFVVDVSPETLTKTTLGDRRPGDPVNLERALGVGGRLGGHWVTGHVDASGAFVKRSSAGEGAVVEFGYPPQFAPHFVAKGSVTIDGVSLTVNTVTDDTFSVFLIPHTLEVTTLGRRRPGDRVNLETDLLGKYVLRALSLRGTEGGGVDEAFLRDHGWL